ncbi:MAG: LysM peptidoglycan-binding domain-containing protein [Bacteroidia bacterium]
MGINKTILLISFQLICFAFGALSVNAQTDTSAYQFEGTWVKNIIVEKGRTIYNITKTYTISELELNRLNPELSSGLKAGMSIRVPAEKPKEFAKETSSTPNPSLKGALKHTVKKKESVFGIAKMYGVTVDDIYTLNPQARDGIKTGMELTIYPRPTVQPKMPLTNVDSAENQTVKEIIKTISCNPIPRNERKQQVNISLLLPFYLPPGENLDTRSRIGLDFYGGVKLAMDSLNKEGISMNIHVFDTQNDSATVNAVLNDEGFQKSDIIIGPLYSSAFIRVAEKARELNIPAITPFSQSDALIDGFPNVIKVTPGSENQVESLPPALKKKYPGAKFFLIDSELSKDKKLNTSFLNAWNQGDSLLRPQLVQQKLSVFRADMKGLDFVKQNIIVFLCTDEVKVIDLSTKLERIKENHRLQLVGLNDWNSFDNLDYELLNALHFTYASAINSDFSSASSMSFQKNYRNDFKGEPTFYSYQGFDISYYFTKKFAMYGKDFRTCLAQMPLECGFNSCYQFAPADGNRGLENKNVNVLRLDDFKVVRLSDYE